MSKKTELKNINGNREEFEKPLSAKTARVCCCKKSDKDTIKAAELVNKAVEEVKEDN